MSQYEIDIALEGAGLYVSNDAPALSGVALENLISQYNNVQKLIERLSRRYPTLLLNELIYSKPLSAEFAKSSKYDLLERAVCGEINGKRGRWQFLSC